MPSASKDDMQRWVAEVGLFDESLLDDDPRPARASGLRGARVPFEYHVSKQETYEGIDTMSGRIGLLKFPFHVRGDARLERSAQVPMPRDVRYAGGYQWKGAVTKADLEQMKSGRASQERVFVTPGIPDVLIDPRDDGQRQHQLETDYKNGFVDYVSDAKALSLLPNTSPFEPIFYSLTSRAMLDGLDLIVDINTLWIMIDLLLHPHDNAARIDAEVVGDTVLFHRWFPNMIGAGEPHRHWVLSYTQSVTRRGRGREGEPWRGGTTQLVRYELGGLGMLVRYPIAARLDTGASVPGGVAAAGETEVEHKININPDSVERRQQASIDTHLPPVPHDHVQLTPDPSTFLMIKVHSVAPPPPHRLETREFDLAELYTRMLLSDTQQCLLAPHQRGNFDLDLDQGPHHHRPQLLALDSEHHAELSRARHSVQAVLPGAVELWTRMIQIARVERRMVTFIIEDGRVGVWKCSRNKHRAQLSLSAQAMLRAAEPSTLAGKPHGVPHYITSKHKTVGDWADMANGVQEMRVERWGSTYDSRKGL